MSLLKHIFNHITVVKDFPKKGIVFRHIGNLLKNATLFKCTIKEMLKNTSTFDYDVVCGLDARGFIISTAVQYELNLSQVMIRKQSKLPGPKYTYEYKKEYGTDILELEKYAITEGQRVLIVDDLMATAGTLIAAINLVEQAGGVVVGVMVLVEFKDLKGRERINALYPNVKVTSLFSLDSFDERQELMEAPVVPSVPPVPSVPSVPSEIKEFRPTEYNKVDNLPVLMWHPSMESFAQKMFTHSNLRPSYINWSYFPDGMPNITFEPSKTLMNKDIVFIMSIARLDIFTEQLALLIALPRQLINSLTVVVCYLGPATHERVDYSGQLATVEPILKIISSCIPMTKSGPPILRIFDIHALQERFYTNDKMTMKLMSAIPVLLKYIEAPKEPKRPSYIIVYPDDGAYKRFKSFFEEYPQIICSKIREGNTRKIIIRDRINWPEWPEVSGQVSELHGLIIDDLVQSGETMLSCAKALKSQGFNKISLYATHAVFPNNSWKKFVGNDTIEEFILTDTNPEVADKLVDVKPFTILNVQSYLCEELSMNTPSIIAYSSVDTVTNVYVASTNVDKLMAIYETHDTRIYRIFSVSGISSGVPEQPYTLIETIYGCRNRLANLETITKSHGLVGDLYAIENGIYTNNSIYIDVPIVLNNFSASNPIFINDIKTVIPKEYNSLVDRSLSSENRSVTFGSLMQKVHGKKDWHKFISGVSRKDMMKLAIKNYKTQPSIV